MKNLQELLKNENYKKIKFRVTKTQHLVVKASINGIHGNFILDTGASSSCVGFGEVNHFGLVAADSKTIATGAGATGLLTQLAKDNLLKIGAWIMKDFHLIVFDMSHVNQALIEHDVDEVQGILGADILLKGKAIIDYYNHCLYLK